MRIYFPNLTRPKKAAKRLAALERTLNLASAQGAIAQTAGYRDWNDLEQHYADQQQSVLDEELTEADFHTRSVELTFALAGALAITDGGAQWFLSNLRLTGNRRFSVADHETIRTACWRRGPMPWRGAQHAGAVFSIRESGKHLRRAYLRNIMGGVRAITDISSDSVCADFEASFPRTRMADFIPLRFLLPYGWWRLADGTQVIFSRDYKPMWSVRPGSFPERTEPWLRVNFVEQHWLGGDSAEADWKSDCIGHSTSERFAMFGITGLPILADVVPILVSDAKMDLGAALLQMKQATGNY